LSEATLEGFLDYDWPGNVRELENLVKRMVVLGNEQTVLEEMVREQGVARERRSEPLLDFEAVGADLQNGGGVDLKAIAKRAAQIAEKRVIEKVLEQTRWNRKEAAARLQISYKALLYKMRENDLAQAR
jgi:two-component system response regulator AtoC